MKVFRVLFNIRHARLEPAFIDTYRKEEISHWNLTGKKNPHPEFWVDAGGSNTGNSFSAGSWNKSASLNTGDNTWSAKPADTGNNSWGAKPMDTGNSSWGTKPANTGNSSWGDKSADTGNSGWGDKSADTGDTGWGSKAADTGDTGGWGEKSANDNVWNTGNTGFEPDSTDRMDFEPSGIPQLDGLVSDDLENLRIPQLDGSASPGGWGSPAANTGNDGGWGNDAANDDSGWGAKVNANVKCNLRQS